MSAASWRRATPGRTAELSAWPPGNGEMARRIRAHDWAATPLGPVETWPQSLCTTVSLCLASNFPINIIWGPGHIQVYNDGYRECCGDAHPRALGEDYCVTWASAWPVIGDSFERALDGETVFLENRRMFLARLHGALEETFFTFSHSPIGDESGGTGGLFHPVTETTDTMLAERRTRALRDLGASLALAENEDAVARRTVEVLAAFEYDLPFLQYYRHEPRTGDYRLAASHGVPAGWGGAPDRVTAETADPWPFSNALHGRDIVEVAIPASLGAEPLGPYPEAPRTAFVLPVVVPAAEQCPAVIIAGASSRLPVTEAYRAFYPLLRVTVANALSTVRAREDERRRAEALAEIDRAKTLFFSNVSHEFRTPLTLMLGPLEEVLARPAVAGEDRGPLAVAHRNGLRLLRLVNALLDFSQVEAGRARARYEATDLAVFTAELASNFRSACERAGLRLIVDCPPLPGPVHLDRDMWEKVVLNLVSNAFKFTFEGEIAVTVRPEGERAVLTVRDTGTGIPEAELPHIFERFHRVENARGRTHEGTGIGLALVQELVQLQRGTIEVESNLGRGTAFTVRLAFATAHLPTAGREERAEALASTATRADAFVEEALRWLPDADGRAPGTAPMATTGEALPFEAPRPHGDRRTRVLLADDNADMRNYVRRLLSDRYDVEAAPDGEAAWAAIEARRPDIVLTDVMMPRLDGFGLLGRVRGSPALRDLPVVVLSARTGEESKVEGLEAGADDYLVKPFDARELLARVAANLAMARLRRQAAEAVSEREERLRALLTATSYVVYSMSPDWTEMRRLDGHGFLADTPEPSSAWLDEYIFSEDQPRVLTAIREAIRTRSVFELEHRVRRADGGLGWTHSRAVPLLDAAGEVREWFGAASDVTARRRAEEALRESEERFRRFGEASSDVLWIRDAGTLRWEYLSPAFEAIYGMPVEDALAGEGLRNWTGLILEEDRAHAVAGIARVCEGERVRFEYRIRRRDGGVRWLRNTDFPIHGPGGRVERIGGIGQDITEVKRVEGALREEEARQRALVEGIFQLVWRSDEDGLWTWSSPQWRGYTGQGEEQSRGHGWLDALHPDDREAAREAWRRAEPDGVLQVDCRIRHAYSGGYAWFQIRGRPVRGGRTAEWIGSCTDIDDQVRAREVLARAGEELEARVAERTAELMAAEESLRHAQKIEAVGQLTGGIAHDFNNMLQGVGGGIAMGRRQIDQGHPERAARYLDAAHGAVERAAGLTRRLLAFARRQRLEAKPVNADALVAGLADLIRRTVGPGIAVELRLHGGAVSVLCDPNELESALLNLCINARDAMPDGGRLAIHTDVLDISAADLSGGEAAPGAYVEISVRDTGMGMPPEVLARVFEPFFTTKPQGQGTGLGLSQVHGFIRQSDGLVRIESMPGRGTSVRLLLPLREGVPAGAEGPSPPASPEVEAQGTVLLVDDEDNVRRPLADRLREMGVAVLEARDGPDALRVLASSRLPDLLVTDVGLPNGMNGRQVAEAARERVPRLPVLFITGYAGTALPPGIEVIGKPFELEALVRRVQVILDARRRNPDSNPGT